MATQWLSPPEMAAWLAFIETTGDLMKAIERDLAPFGLDRGDYQLLAMLSEADLQRLRMSELADTLRLTRSGLTRRMEGVVKKKLVSKVQCPEDGRVVFGTTVELIDVENSQKVVYQIVGDDEADLKVGKISISSPIARALIGKSEGDVAIVHAPSGPREVEILSVRYA